jgi:hypothetical protein
VCLERELFVLAQHIFLITRSSGWEWQKKPRFVLMHGANKGMLELGATPMCLSILKA